MGRVEASVVMTGDGSHTLRDPATGQHYHSTFGAVTESAHIFIDAGFHFSAGLLPADISQPKRLRILEIGFGTGLNALLTLAAGESSATPVFYTAVEKYPVSEDVWKSLNFTSLPGLADTPSAFRVMHQAPWNRVTEINPAFSLHKLQTDACAFTPEAASFDLVYHDAFAPDVQPELWSSGVLAHLYEGLASGGILVTYSVKGEVVRAMKSTGFSVEKLPGPPGKRHILRAQKL